MSVIGFNLAKGELRWTSLSGTKQSPKLEAKGRRVYAMTETDEICHWFRQNLSELLDQQKNSKVAYRLTWDINKKAQAGYLIMPLGILHLLSRERGLACIEHHTASLTHRKLGVSVKASPIAMCDAVFQPHPPYWDDAQKYSVLAAWAELD